MTEEAQAPTDAPISEKNGSSSGTQDAVEPNDAATADQLSKPQDSTVESASATSSEAQEELIEEHDESENGLAHAALDSIAETEGSGGSAPEQTEMGSDHGTKVEETQDKLQTHDDVTLTQEVHDIAEGNQNELPEAQNEAIEEKPLLSAAEILPREQENAELESDLKGASTSSNGERESSGLELGAEETDVKISTPVTAEVKEEDAIDSSKGEDQVNGHGSSKEEDITVPEGETLKAEDANVQESDPLQADDKRSNLHELMEQSESKEEVQNFSDDDIVVDGVSSDSESESEPESSYSESDNNSDSDYADSGVEEDDDDQIIAQEIDEEEAELIGGPIISTNETSEVAPQLPKDYRIDENTPIEHAGQIIGLVDQSMIIKANTSGEFRVLKEESVFCFQDRTVIGPLCETFGRLQQPIYRVKFNTEEEFEPFKNRNGEEVYYVVPDSQFLYTDSIKQLKGTDASNCHDEELPEDEQEHSDDEQELSAKQAKKKKKQKTKTAGQAAENSANRKRNTQPVDQSKRYQPYNYAQPVAYQQPQQPYQAYPPPPAQPIAYHQPSGSQTGQPMPYQQQAYPQPPIGAYGQGAPALYQQPPQVAYQQPPQPYGRLYPPAQPYQAQNEFVGNANSPYGVPFNQAQHAYYQNNGQGYLPQANSYPAYPVQGQFQPQQAHVGEQPGGYQLQQQIQQLQQMILMQVNLQNEAQQKNGQTPPGGPAPTWR